VSFVNEPTLDRLTSALADRYAIEREIGEGGMATVYLARDLKHNRSVALKVLKPELAAVVGAERFLAEIETTANLQHPHILPLYDSGEADGFLFYVMPYVEGETLRDRLDREKQLPVDDAVRIGTAVANALDYAHQHGVVHRDIKPGNILLQAGQPVVGDFGIALAVGSAGGARLTETGLSVGTPYYMSPEQATGDMHVGPATDIYALGAVLYELLTGDPPYMGSTAQAVLGQIIAGEPVSATTRRRSIPANVDAALRCSLEKLPADRFTSASGLAAALADPGFRYGGATGGAAAGGPGFWRPLAVVSSIVAVVAVGLVFRGRPAPVVPAPVERFAAPFLPGDELTFVSRSAYRLSHDGTMLVYRHDPGTGQVLYLRRWDELRAAPIRDTEGASYPDVSYDGLELAFQQDGEIRVLAFAGGPVRTLGAGLYPLWGSDGYVYFAGSAGALRAPSTGGAVEQLTTWGPNETGHAPLQLLPGGKMLLAVQSAAGLDLQVVDLDSGEARTLVPNMQAVLPRYLPSGHLVYASEGVLTAVAFDPEAGVMLGSPVPILEDVRAFSLSDTGKLFYTLGNVNTGGLELTMQWVDREGNVTPVDPDWTLLRGSDTNFGFELSPDGTRLAIREETAEGYDIWVKQLDRGPRSRLTFDPGHDRMPIWSRDGSTVYFLSDRGGNNDVWRRPADGTGQPELVFDLEENLGTISLSPDGEWLLARSSAGTSSTAARDIYAVPLNDEEAATPLLATDYRELNPVVSPDGRWIAYASDETGRYEIYVRPFPNVEAGRWQVSIGGGRNPQWAHQSGELFFQDPDERMMAARVDADGDAFAAQPPVALFQREGRWLAQNLTGVFYDVAPDDQRFLMAGIVPQEGAEVAPEGPAGILVNNFDVELLRRVPR
jgi:Tol biopolymer transport system component